jgi:hypothetical protein
LRLTLNIPPDASTEGSHAGELVVLDLASVLTPFSIPWIEWHSLLWYSRNLSFPEQIF